MRLDEIDTRDKRTLAAFGLIGLGLILLIGIGNLILPLIFLITIVAPGLGLMAIYHTGHEAAAPVAIPGAIITGTGAILLFQSLTGYWESWSYAWTLYGVFLGIGLMLMADRLGDASLHKVGRGFVMVSGIAFLVLGSLFIVLSSDVLRPLFILAFIGGGVYLLMSRRRVSYTPRPRTRHSAPIVEENIQQIRRDADKHREIA
jgi:hypothetical protein